MDESITDRALALAKAKGWNQQEFAEAIGAEKQHVTNWKKRGFPPARYAKAAEVLGITVEQLITGRIPAQEAPTTSRIGETNVSMFDVKVTPEAMLFAAEWTKLPSALQAQVSALVHMMVAELARARNQPGPDPKGTKASKPRKPDRPNA